VKNERAEKIITVKDKWNNRGRGGERCVREPERARVGRRMRLKPRMIFELMMTIIPEKTPINAISFIFLHVFTCHRYSSPNCSFTGTSGRIDTLAALPAAITDGPDRWMNKKKNEECVCVCVCVFVFMLV
jgi:hypothetical protein